MKTVLITGAKGFLGRHLAREMSARGWVVAGLGHGIWPDAEAKGYGLRHWLNGEISAGNLETVCATAGLPDVVMHLAGGSSVGASIDSPLEDFERTCATTARLLAWLRRRSAGSRLVAVSSAAVYGERHAAPIPETATPAPASPYGLHKRIMEDLCLQYARDYGIRCVVLRFFSLYGPELRKQLLWDTCARLQAGKSLLLFDGTGAEQRDWLHVSDAARWMAELAARDTPPALVVNGGTGTGTDIRAIVTVLRDAWGSGAAVDFTGRTRSGDPRYLVADTVASRTLGLSPRISLRDGLADYVRWFRSRVAE